MLTSGSPDLRYPTARRQRGSIASAGRALAIVLTWLLATMFSPAAVLAQAGPHSPSQEHRHNERYYDHSELEGSRLMLKGGVTVCVPKGTPVKLKLATVPTLGLRLLDRDLDGNLRPAKLGEHISARTSEDIYVDDNKVIPAGTTLEGYVSKIYPPRRFYRPGHLELSFTELKLPDGRRFAFRADADNYKPSTWKSKARGTGRIMAHAAGGAIVGALVAYQIFGMKSTISMHGYNIAGGAAGGALLATGYAMMTKGPKAVLEPGDDLNMSIDSDLLMPAAVTPKAKAPLPKISGVNIEVKKIKKIKDGLGSQLLRTDLVIENNSEERLRSIDLFLEDTNGNRNAISSGDDFECEMNFTVSPHSVKRVRVYFSLEWPKLKHKLVWLDHQSRQPALVMPVY